MAVFQTVPEKIDFPEEETKVLQMWEDTDAFQTSLKMSEGKPEFSFYDGPPFATGMPHYGHILTGTIKDIVTRYAHQTGHHVVRRFGWDCHGLPIEFEIDNKLGINTREDVLKLGIDKYNAECRGIVMRFSKEWERIVKRFGRWIDFEHDYKTLDASFMETVWWVFRQLFDKNLVYRGFKVMPYSTACNTPLSNFEANLNYKDVSDPAITISFPMVNEPDVAMLAWTTTPWTLPSNLALCVNPEMNYVKLQDKKSGRKWIVAESRLIALYKESEKDQYTILETFKGRQLENTQYIPLFDYFASLRESGAFRVICDTYVTDDSGTGIVHCAPAFGEDDFRVCLANGVITKSSLTCAVDDNGRFTKDVPDYVGRHVKSCDDDIKKVLKEKGRLIHASTIVHSYPFCWRSETPLIYKAVPSWFVKVEDIKDKLLKNNKESYWVPAFVQEKRFHNWLQDARDWCVSRNRFWGTPLPLWVSDDWEEIVCVGSIKELEELTGVTGIDDIHRDKIDHLTIPSRRGPQFGVLHRVDEVFDCWFESGSMPYGQLHYPFENVDRFEKSFPADFIAEGLDQTRGWFYTLLVISTALFDKPPFKNLIVNGLVLAADGKKMSKRLKNYPDPMEVVNELGADAIRLYLINSPVVRAEPLRFKKEGVRDVIKDVFLPWFNAYRFFVQNANRLPVPFAPVPNAAAESGNVMDRWITVAAAHLIKFVREEMQAYRLYTVVPQLLKFLDQLTNWYVRLNRLRLKGSNGVEDCRLALATLYEVLLMITKAMAPFTPYITEYMYQNLRSALPDGHEDKAASLHFLSFPSSSSSHDLLVSIDPRIEDKVAVMQRVIELGRQIRERKQISLKTPLRELTVVSRDAQLLDDVYSLRQYVQEELNVRSVVIDQQEEKYVTLKALPEAKVLGPRLGKGFGPVNKAIKELSHDAILEYERTGSLTVANVQLQKGDITINREFTSQRPNIEAAVSGEITLILDILQDDTLKDEGLAREAVNRVQKLRKKCGLNLEDDVEVFFSVKGDDCVTLRRVMSEQKETINNALRAPLLSDCYISDRKAAIIATETYPLADGQLVITITRTTPIINATAFKAVYGAHGDGFMVSCADVLRGYDVDSLRRLIESNNGVVRFILDDVRVELKANEHFFIGARGLAATE